ncbi:hypothetical protein [Natronincola ferrireducens]|uniref:Uncharacterized protein n=1 Tax=Natronincola ferrireducens TaxID=393762 RepID=A0A1G9I2Y2_9FIRM|nr:hypothetical protein [Natronincola ferrireducens]SDL19607.1 hypothetical protein SAMN05660472_02783 [Natronincola ferrireducens]
MDSLAWRLAILTEEVVMNGRMFHEVIGDMKLLYLEFKGDNYGFR